MSTVCCDGVGIAADGKMTLYDRMLSMNERKVHRLNDGSIIGGCGNPAYLPKVVEWLNKGRRGKWPIEGDDGFSAIWLRSDGVSYFDNEGGETTPALPVAVGSGSGMAIGALEAGASLRQAIEIASKHDVWTGGQILVEYLHDDTKATP